MSTLPWQQNFAGLIGGIFFGMGLTFALVPFVNITKYNRKSKVSLSDEVTFDIDFLAMNFDI